MLNCIIQDFDKYSREQTRHLNRDTRLAHNKAPKCLPL